MTDGTGGEVRRITLYEAIGGEAVVDRLTRRFYELMDRLPEAAACRAIHPESLEGSREKLFMYLTGWLGGPPLFTAKFGAPMLRARHLPFAVDADARDGWLVCFNQALDETVTHPEVRAMIRDNVTKLAFHMQNKG
ncbi:group II truncated hemoglobin [Methylobrevis pamukkalensis]|uniref:Group 2 truncated hemoglobin YjbI n=1 Tax=Methylobrevis pamukkalensis TaxID=1439726 RepID=A0A1E3GZL1_9HYPH|nr:group II truncated hemoglobin [Methylobrevis pamukkalensis]ODN69355.1 Group 2 truncated hemoglobin YjbI [Methylobrevis pamukkalensis]